MRPAERAEDLVSELFKIGAVLLIAIVGLVTVVGHPRQTALTSLGHLGDSVLPNLAALLLTYLIVATILERRGVSPQQRFLSRIVSEVTASVKPVAGIREAYQLTSETPYGAAFMRATRVQIVGRAFNETLMRHPDELREFFRVGGRLELVLMDVRDETTVDIATKQYAGQPVVGGSNADAVTFKAMNTIVALQRACEKAKVAFSDCVTVYVYSSTMNYWGLRFSGPDGLDDLYFAPYDNFRMQTLACPTVVWDLDLATDQRDFWDAEFAGFVRDSLPFDEWAIKQTCEDIQQALGLGDRTANPLKLDIAWPYAESALIKEAFELVEAETVDDTRSRSMTWRHPNGGNLQVLVGQDDQIIRTTWEPPSDDREPAMPSPAH